MKKLLILAGANVHCKVVKTAKEMGIYTIVTDYLPVEDSPAKQIADEYWMLDIKDVDSIVEKCKLVGVDGVINFCIDPAQKPYQQICEKLDLPCYGTKEQFDVLTDKRKFKHFCKMNDVDVINEYSLNDYEKKSIKFPVYVKPANSRGSRGQSICYNYTDLDKGMSIAKNESVDGSVIIEDFIENCDEIQITYFFINGIPYLIRTADSYHHSNKDLKKVISCGISPSKYTDYYISTANDRVVNMLKRLGIKYGPVFMQGFVYHDKFLFFDPAIRFPGVNYELILNEVYGLNFMKMLIEFSLTGSINCCALPDECYRLHSNYGVILFPALLPGMIQKIIIPNEFDSNNSIISYSIKHFEGENIIWKCDIYQRIAEVDLLVKDKDELNDLLKRIKESFIVEDDNCNNLVLWGLESVL